MSGRIGVVDLGRRSYLEALELQRALCRRRVAGDTPDDLLLLVEHDPVVTLGRSTAATSLPLPRAFLEARGVAVHEVERGGDATLHAPGQLVGYPILDLTGWRRDLHWYLRALEEALIAALGRFGVPAGRNPGKTGVWVGLDESGTDEADPARRGRKIASIGIHVKQWVTLHGFALNVTTDLSLFDLIVPCGIPEVIMTSVARELGTPACRAAPLAAEVRQGVVDAFGRTFEREMVPTELPDLTLPETVETA